MIYASSFAPRWATMRLEALVDRWHATAGELEAHGAPGPAAAMRRCAEDLEVALRTGDDDVLTMTEAASETGYSADYLRQQVAKGALPNAGSRGRPRILRGDLPPPKRQKGAGTGLDHSSGIIHRVLGPSK